MFLIAYQLINQPLHVKHQPINQSIMKQLTILLLSYNNMFIFKKYQNIPISETDIINEHDLLYHEICSRNKRFNYKQTTCHPFVVTRSSSRVL